jgi:hypothetical protein
VCNIFRKRRYKLTSSNQSILPMTRPLPINKLVMKSSLQVVVCISLFLEKFPLKLSHFPFNHNTRTILYIWHCFWKLWCTHLYAEMVFYLDNDKLSMLKTLYYIFCILIQKNKPCWLKSYSSEQLQYSQLFSHY